MSYRNTNPDDRKPPTPFAESDFGEMIDTRPIAKGRPLYDFEKRSVERLRSELQDPAHVYQIGEVRYWVSNDAVVPPSVFKDAKVRCPESQVVARSAEAEEFFAQYRANQPAEPSDEERAAARAAHGPGVEIVDVISGRTFIT